MIGGTPLLLVDAPHVPNHVGLGQEPVALLALHPLQLEDLPLASLDMPLVHVTVALVAEHAHGFVRSETTFVVEALAANITDELKLLEDYILCTLHIASLSKLNKEMALRKVVMITTMILS